MRTEFTFTLVAIAGALLTEPVIAGAGAPGHSHAGFSAGEPGNPKNPSREIVVTLHEGDGKMAFSHSRIEVRRGEQIRFILKNTGELDHEFILATIKDNDKHAKLMMKYPDMEHADPNAKRVATKKSDELLWRFTTTGEYEFACLIPGHREVGMHGKVVVN
jgi:uncharacterized cupredoxin-like copper-binding protein